MINNLFSTFDPACILPLQINWIRTLIILILIPLNFWFIPRRILIFLWKINIYLKTELTIIIKKNNFLLFFNSLFIFIIINNFIGLFPYIFTRTRHLRINLTISLPLWISIILFGWINNINHIFIHLIPQRTPVILIPFIVLIETIRNVIRPLTLAVRLTANIIAGHLLLSLLRRIKNILPLYLIFILILTQILLLILEISVAIIQAYVFIILASLYSNEIN